MKDLIQERLSDYHCKTAQEEENAIKEITQEVVLYCLFKSKFFVNAEFHGGTCLRIFHRLDRFSEDLDFTLNKPNPTFNVEPFLEFIVDEMKIYGFELTIATKEKNANNVVKRFLKDDHIKQVIEFKHYSDLRSKIKVKFELDINPPLGVQHEIQYLSFPMGAPIVVHDIPSMFALKCHALLCREYVKGRDWYDFLWYIRKRSNLNLFLLKNALYQTGPWKNMDLNIDPAWIKTELKRKIHHINWRQTRSDVQRFIKPEKQEELSMWSVDFFTKMLFESLIVN